MNFNTVCATVLAFACSLAGAGAGAGQAAPSTVTRTAWTSDILHTAWTAKDGAPSAVYSMTQDGNGFLWFAARDGLYSFDGARFVRRDNVYGHALHSPSTTAVAAFGETIWVAYQYGGIGRFDPGGAHHFQAGVDGPNGSSHLLVRTPDGIMWANGAGGVWRLDGERWRLVTEEEGLPPDNLPHITLLDDGQLLVSASSGMYRGAPTAGHGQYRFEKMPGSGRLVGGSLWPDGKLLLRTLEDGMWTLDLASGERTPFRPDNGNAPNLGYRIDDRGGLWVSTGDAVQLFDRAGKLRRQFLTANGFSAGSFTGVMSDREGNTWIATPNGVDRVRPARLSTLELPPGYSSNLNVTAGLDGAVWVSESFVPDARPMPTFERTADGAQRMTAMRSVVSGHRQDDGTLWFAGIGSLWRVRDGGTQEWTLPPAMRGRTVQSMTTDRDGLLWISVVGRGVYSFRDGVWSPGNGDPELAKRPAIVLATDGQGRVWFGYPGDRVAVLDRGVVRDFDRTQGLDIGNVLAIHAGRGRIWFGGDRGLAWFDGQRFVSVKENGSPGFRGISGIVERGGGELWLHDAGGLARIDAEAAAALRPGRSEPVDTERFDHRDGHRGTPPQIRPLPSLIEASDGRLWYVTSSSIGHVDPGAITRNTLAPTVLIDAIRTDRQAYPPRPGLVLPSGSDRLEIGFTATALSIPERVRFRYRLAGQDDQWRDAGTLRQAVYTNLAPGAYTFEVRAANEDGVWSPAPARAAFRTEPSFVQTNWFKLACLALVLAAAWMLHRWRLRRVESRLLEHLQLRERERARIARTLHDTFLQSVQALVLRMHALLGKLPGDGGAHAEVEEVLARAEDVMNEGRERVRQLRSPAVRHGCLLKALEEAGQAMAAASGIPYSQHVSGTARELDPEIEDELFAIGREALSNAFQHARPGKVTLSLDYCADHLRLKVSDDGRGIAPEVLSSGARQGHWGLPGMEERARLAGGVLEIDSTAGGTTVGVCIPLAGARHGRRRA